jgi:predicted DNA-binding mobile mystery protein A
MWWFMKKNKLMIKQLDRQLTDWLQTKNFFQPRNGWISCIRKALGMTLPQLAKRLKVVRSRIIKIQETELSGTLTIHTLQEVARALNCDLVYAFIPRKTLSILLREQAEKIAKQRLDKVSHSMKLENQGVSSVYQQEQLKEMTNELLDGYLKHLWENES